MKEIHAPTSGGQSSPTTAGKLLRRDGRAIAAAAAVTLIVELGVYLGGRMAGAPPLAAAIAAMFASALWIAIAAPVVAASGASALSAACRGGTVCDASGLALIVLWLTVPEITLAGGARIYCTYVAVAMAGAGAVRLARSQSGRYIAAVGAAVILFAAMATPFWTGGLLGAPQEATRHAIAATAVLVNPLYSIASATAEHTHFVWHQWPIIYGITRIGDYAAAPPVPWYASAIIYGFLAGMMWSVGLIRQGRSRQA